MRALIPVVLAAAAIAASLAPGGRAAASLPPAPATPSRPAIRRIVLANGLRLLCKPNDSSEIVAIVAQVRAGLPDEPDDRPGLAALTAESLLQGTATKSGQSLAQAIVNAGGDLHSQSAFDFTEISAVSDQGRWQTALKLIADVLAHPSFEAEGVVRARETLRRRLTSAEDEFPGAVYQALLGQLFINSTYGRPLFGTPAGLARLTADDVRRFWSECYLQNRITVAIVGDVDPTQAMRVAQPAFEDIPFRKDGARAPITVEPLSRPRVELVQKPGPSGIMMVGFQVPPVSAAAFPVYSVLEALLGGGKRSRLSANLREQNGLGYVLGCDYQPLLGPSYLAAYMMFPVPPPEVGSPTLDRPKTLLLQQLRDAAEKGFTEPEITRAKAYAIGQYARRHERNRDAAKWLSWCEASGIGTRVDQEFAVLAGGVTKEQLQAAAKDLLKNYALVISVPPPD